MNDEEKFLEIKSKAEEAYKSLGEVYCPYFSENITFNIKGLNHIKMKRWNKARSREDQFMRLKLLKLAPEVIKKSSTLQGFFKSKNFERIQINSKWTKFLTNIYYFEFIAIIKNIRIKVIIKQTEGGQKYFWSIIPFWKTNKDNTERILHDGNPDED